MLVQPPQFTLPFAAAEAMGAVDAELVQRSFQALVGHGSEARLVTQRTWLAIFPDTLDARLAIAVSATADKVRLAKDLKADGALALELLLWRLDEFAFVPTFLFRLSRRLLVVVTAGGFTSHFSWQKKGGLDWYFYMLISLAGHTNYSRAEVGGVKGIIGTVESGFEAHALISPQQGRWAHM